MSEILCPYHGPRPALVGSAGESICSACAAAIEDRPIAALARWVPLAPLIAGGAQKPAGNFEPREIDFTISPAQELLATQFTPLLPVDDIYALIPLHIQALERAMTENNILPLGPLLLLYDHPDVKDFSRVRFSAAYPVAPEIVAPAAEKIPLERRLLSSMRVAQIQFRGPWSQLHLAYPPLRKAILAAQVGFGPLTIERYLIPRGTHHAQNLTLIQREIAG